MRAPRLLLLALLALALGCSAQRAVLAGGTVAAAAGAAGSGASASAPSGSHWASQLRSALLAAEQHGGQLIGEQAASVANAAAVQARPTEDELAAAALFQHPLAPAEWLRNGRAGAQTHWEMQRWLRAFFASDASRLTSTRLQAAQLAAAGRGGRGPQPLQVGEAGDVLATAGGPPCNASCARRAAEELLLAGEAPGHGFMPLVWPQFPEDRRRWAAVRAAGSLGSDSGGEGGSMPVAAVNGSAKAAGSDGAPAAADSSIGGGVSEGNRRALAVPDGSHVAVAPDRDTSSAAANSSAPAGANGTAAARAAANSSSLGASTESVPTCLPRQPWEHISRDYLVVAAVGNNVTTIDRWMSMPESATFDLVLLHYGNGEPLSCPHCRAVVRAAGPKWQLVWQLTQQPLWAQLMAGKKAVMFPDDDVIFDTCAINRAFELFTAYGLLLGQPSLCPVQHRPSWYLHLVQQPQFTLRFVTMVEIMAPIFEADFFQGLARPSLWDAYTGWGLDFVWPFLLQFPRDRVGVIDEVCMTHPHSAQTKQGDGSIYAALAKVAPYDAREEEARRDAQFDYYPSSCHALGFGYRPLDIVGEVPDPLFVPPPPPEEQLPPSPQALSPVAASAQVPFASAAGPAGGVQAHPSPAHTKLQPNASLAPPPPPQRQQLEAASERLRKHLSDVQPSVVYLQVAVAAAVAVLLLWQRGKRRPGSPLLSPRGGTSQHSPLPTHTVRSPRASPVKLLPLKSPR